MMYAKKVIVAVLIFCVSFAFVSCGTNGDKNETTEKAESVVYENVVFDDLKTFTEITGVELNSVIEEITYRTTFCYVVFEDVDQKINDYKTYLSEAGFKMTSDLDDESVTFELNEKEIYIYTESGKSGSEVEISIPCDEETNALRKEQKYKELIKAAEEKDFNKVFDITGQYSSEEIKEYKDVYAYRLFSIAMKAYDLKVYGEAAEYFTSYLEEQPEDKLGAKAYLQECNDKISKYNGMYSGKSFNGLVNYYMFIKDGKVGFDFNHKAHALIGYNPADAVYYLHELRVNEYDNGLVSLTVGDYSFGDIKYKYDLTLLEDGSIIVNEFGWNPAMGYYNDNSTFAGKYERIADPPPAK